MNRKKAINIYLFGIFGQMIIASLLSLLFKNIPIISVITIIIGGISTAMWGIIISNKYKNISFKQVIIDFFNIKKLYKYYYLIVLFLLLDFIYILFGGGISINIWYTPLVLFIKAIIFGGIEEIGWRYTFQPILEEKINYVFATIITFIFWGIWHFLYFYIDGSIYSIEVVPFLVGLLTNCFILSSLFKVTKSLSICVITHSLINTLAQIVYGGNELVSIISSIIIIMISIIICSNKKIIS